MSDSPILKFDKDYYETEKRGGYVVERLTKHAWAAEMEVLAEIDSICKRHGLHYFAEWGTMLGAVRHKGFIPWDDDLEYHRFPFAAGIDIFPYDFIPEDPKTVGFGVFDGSSGPETIGSCCDTCYGD